MNHVAALFVREDSHYKTMPGVDAWDINRDARRWPGATACVAHPPCRAWGRMYHMAKPRDDEKELARWAVYQVRLWGGVLEHPSGSKLWPDQGLPLPGEPPDEHGGYTLAVEQFHWGHRALKRTWLYVVGCPPVKVPAMPRREGQPTHCIARTSGTGTLPHVTHAEREQTPPAFALWLVNLASLCSFYTPVTKMLRAEVKAASSTPVARWYEQRDVLVARIQLVYGVQSECAAELARICHKAETRQDLPSPAEVYRAGGVRLDYAKLTAHLRDIEKEIDEHNRQHPSAVAACVGPLKKEKP